MSEFGHVGGWVLLWFSLVRFFKGCLYFVPFAMDGYFWSDGWFGLFCYMIWLGCIGENIGLCLLWNVFLWVMSWKVSQVGLGAGFSVVLAHI